jgi:hypothetical protein
LYTFRNCYDSALDYAALHCTSAVHLASQAKARAKEAAKEDRAASFSVLGRQQTRKGKVRKEKATRFKPVIVERRRSVQGAGGAAAGSGPSRKEGASSKGVYFVFRVACACCTTLTIMVVSMCWAGV